MSYYCSKHALEFETECPSCRESPKASSAIACPDLLRQLVLDCINDLATYIVPDSGITEHDVVNTLLGRLDGPQARAALKTESVPPTSEREELSEWVTKMVSLLCRWREYHRMDADIEGDSLKAQLWREIGELLSDDVGRWTYHPKLDALARSAIANNEIDWQARALAAEAKLNAPELVSFRDAVVLEAAHQRERWGTDHDGGKTVEDWLWLVAYLATKASQANRYGDREKYIHHIITCGAACANWHAFAIGVNSAMRPGVDPAKYESAVARDKA